METLATLLDLSGKTAIVTGSAKGIGRAICLRLAEAGANVLATDFDQEGADDIASEIMGLGQVARALRADMASEDDIKAMIEAATDAFGGLDILVNNAGIYPMTPVAEMPTDLFERVINVNLRGVFLATKYAAAAMRAAGNGGKIINITSIDALHPSMEGLAAYDASKHGVWGFTKNAALEYADDRIWINAIAPGGVATPGTGVGNPNAAIPPGMIEAMMQTIPMHRMGEADEIAKVALFLASDMSSYMTGSQIVVDGGKLLK